MFWGNLLFLSSCDAAGYVVHQVVYRGSFRKYPVAVKEFSWALDNAEAVDEVR